VEILVGESVFLYVWCGNGVPTPRFSQYIPACQQRFLDKSSAQHETRCFLSTNILLSLIIFFNLLYSISKIALPRYSRVSYRKIEWVRIWSLTHYKLHVSRCEVEKYCLIIFNTLVMQLTPSRAKCQHNFCFRVFRYVFSTRTPSSFRGEEKLCLFSK